MIRINLIPHAKRSGKRAAAASVPGEGPSFLLITVVFLLVVGAGGYFWYTFVAKQRDGLRTDLQHELAEKQRLSDVRAKYEASLRQVQFYQARLKIIDDLKSKQSGPVDLLNLVADTVSSTDQVWLESMTNDGQHIDFTGMALSPDAVANLMRTLMKTGAFRAVEIKETSQDSALKDIQAFKFEVVCELSPNSSAASAPGATPAPAPGAKPAEKPAEKPVDKRVG